MTARVQIIQDYRESMGGVEFNRVVEEEDDGLSYFLGLGLDTPLKVMKLTKKLVILDDRGYSRYKLFDDTIVFSTLENPKN